MPGIGFPTLTGTARQPELKPASTAIPRASAARRETLATRALVSTQDSEYERAVEESRSFPLDGGRLGWGWEPTLAPPPRPSPTTGGGRILNSPRNPRRVDT